MTILNLMLGKKRGGLEQAALDYGEALMLAGIPALTVISPEAWLEALLVAAQVPHQSLANLARWDPLAMARLRRLVKKTKATVIICHGNRALTLALLALKGRLPIIAVTHNYSTRRFTKADACFAITEHLARHLRHAGIEHITRMPNMVRVTQMPPRSDFHIPPIIGAMGRLVMKKGFDTYIHALAIVKSRGVAFQAILGGEGSRAEALAAHITHYGLEQQVELRGWIKDKQAFFGELDMFVLPSLHEPFGIVLLEAMSYGVPVITSDAEGPRELVQPNIDALMTTHGNAEAMADAIIALIGNPLYAKSLATAAHRMITEHYSLPAMAARLKTALQPYMASHG